jgi:hypothetical protein
MGCCVPQQMIRPKCRYGSFSTVSVNPRDVRFTPNSVGKSDVRSVPGRCARPASGLTTAAPPTSAMGCVVHHSNLGLPMPALGQKQRLWALRPMSALSL